MSHLAECKTREQMSTVNFSCVKRTVIAVSRWLQLGILAIGFFAVVHPIDGRAQSASDPRRLIDSAIAEAQRLEAPLLAPKNYAEARRLYDVADGALRRGAPTRELATAIDAATTAARRASQVATEMRGALNNVLQTRAAVLGFGVGSDTVRRAETLFNEAIARAELGDRAGAGRTAEQAVTAYLRAGAAALRETKLANARQTLERLRGNASEDTLASSRRDLDSLDRALGADRLALADVVELDRRLSQFIDLLFPPFYRDPPMTLLMGGFTLYVENYEQRSWNFRIGAMTGAAGFAWVSFDCSPKILSPFPGAFTVAKAFRVVDTVRDKSSEISRDTALRLNPQAKSGESLELRLPQGAVTEFEISLAIAELIVSRLRPRGHIRVHFDNLTITPGPQPDFGIVTAGQAVYPTTPPVSPPRLKLDGFTLELSQLMLTTSGATVTADLEFPTSIIDPGTGRPGLLPLGSFVLPPNCHFHRELATQAFGPWAVGNTDMLIRGTGVTADFDPAWAPPGIAATSAAASPAWRGALLSSGGTVGSSGAITSNSGYLHARYAFSMAEVTGPGLKGHFALTAPFTFRTLEPFDYQVSISKGAVELSNSAVESGEFDDDRIVAPRVAVHDENGQPVNANYTKLDLDGGLNLFGGATIAQAVRWGDFVTAAGLTDYYEVRDIAGARFYLGGTYRANYFPLDAARQFVDARFDTLVASGAQGLTLFQPKYLTVFTPDTPGAKPIAFFYAGSERDWNWLNISYNGVHGRFSKMITDRSTNTDLGPTSATFYEGKEPFRQSPTPISTDIAMVANLLKLPHYHIAIRFVSSATFDCDMGGILAIPAPVKADLPFSNMVFTSTAQNAGGKIPFDDPFKLDYWGVDMVKKPGATSAGVLSVRTGKVLFTAAGIAEPRHFQQPFYLVWGEMRADGGLQRLVFDHNSAGQRLDKFPFTTTFVRLSDYVQNTEAFLAVAGTVHFDFFGPKYLNLHDTYFPAKPNAPYNARRVDLQSDIDPNGAFVASDTQLRAMWSDTLASMDFTFGYDSATQNGFVGTGTMGFLWIGTPMRATIVLIANLTCMTVNETERRDFSLGPVAHLGAMARITGCACLEGGQLQRATLSAELETQEDANIALRAATYGRVDWLVTPTVSNLEITGDMYLSVLLHGNIEVTGRALFTIDRAQDFVEGEVDGRFDTGTALGLGSMSADGQLNWHIGRLGGEAYQSIQGKLAVHLVSVVAGGAFEGGFYLGLNAPKAEAWVLGTGGDQFHLNMAPLPERLTGVYGYGKASSSVNLWVLSGGMEAYLGLGGFLLTPQQVIDLGATSAGNVVGLPFEIGNVGVHVWGEILGGLVGASGWGDFNVITPYPFSIQGTIGLEGCVVWVVCGKADITAGVNSSEGMFVE